MYFACTSIISSSRAYYCYIIHAYIHTKDAYIHTMLYKQTYSCIFLLLAAPVAGMLAIRISIRKTVMLGGLLICIGFILSIFPTEFFYLYFTFGVLVGKCHVFLQIIIHQM